MCSLCSSCYAKVHKLLETCALAQKTIVACIEILQNEVNSASDAERVKSANDSLVQIYMTCQNIDRSWSPLFRKALESVIHDQNIRDHCKVYIKYLKLLRNMKDYALLLKCSVQMLDIYPNEFIPRDMICCVYVKNYYEKSQNFEVRKMINWLSKMTLIKIIINIIEYLKKRFVKLRRNNAMY